MVGDGRPLVGIGLRVELGRVGLGRFAFVSRLRALRKKRASLVIIASAACAWPVTISAETALRVLNRKCGLIW